MSDSTRSGHDGNDDQEFERTLGAEPPATSAEPGGSAAEPGETVEPPAGLAPSPGIAPPSGMAPPSFEAPSFEPPAFSSPSFGAPAPGAPGAPSYDPPSFERPHQPQPFAQGTPQQPTQPQAGGPQPPYQQPRQQYQSQPGPGYGPQPPKRGLSTGGIIAIVAGALVLLLAIIGVIAAGAFFSRALHSVSSPGGGDIDGTGASEIVEEYLHALADGDAATARRLVGGSSSDPLLTDDVLALSLELAPITNIEVNPEFYSTSSYNGVVEATFDLGGESVSRDFSVWNYSSSDSWEISDGLVSLSVSSLEGLDPTINGVEVRRGPLQAFPGAYRIALGPEQFELSGDTDVFTFVTSRDTSQMYEVTPVLTPEATETFRELVRKSLDSCVRMDTLDTPCGFAVPDPMYDGSEPVDKTVKRQLTSEAKATLKRLEPRVSYDAPTVVSSIDYLSLRATVEVKRDGERGTAETLLSNGSRSPHVDFGDAEPSVVWE